MMMMMMMMMMRVVVVVVVAVVIIVTRTRIASSVYRLGYGLEGQEFEPHWGRDFSHPS
jgi:hypothetical protein